MALRERDEGPSEEDLRRFGSEIAFCPDCGAEVWDQADVCPTCFAYLGGETKRRARRRLRLRRSKVWVTVVIVLVLIALVLGLVIGPSLAIFRPRR